MTRQISCLIAIALLIGCVTTRSETPSCEELAGAYQEDEGQFRLLAQGQAAGGTVLSYTASAAGYVTDAVVIIGDGLIKTIIFCPTAVLAISAGHGHFGNAYCHPKHGKDLYYPRFGQSIHRNTKPLRTPNFDPLSERVREIALCYQNRGQQGDDEKARLQLSQLQASDIYRHISLKEKKAVEAQFSSMAPEG